MDELQILSLMNDSLTPQDLLNAVLSGSEPKLLPAAVIMFFRHMQKNRLPLYEEVVHRIEALIEFKPNQAEWQEAVDRLVKLYVFRRKIYDAPELNGGVFVFCADVLTSLSKPEREVVRERIEQLRAILPENVPDSRTIIRRFNYLSRIIAYDNFYP